MNLFLELWVIKCHQSRAPFRSLQCMPHCVLKKTVWIATNPATSEITHCIPKTMVNIIVTISTLFWSPCSIDDNSKAGDSSFQHPHAPLTHNTHRN
ncbi:hypothetical protein TNCV_3670391 [Trichonephila clavipes]|nr:hypothetical protein TNCV_3670391 [Trichonephila clavipes]